MDITEEVSKLIGQPENEQLEYKAVLPPSRNIGQMISAFANSNGGFIVLGVAESNKKIIVNGLSEDFNANAILHKAIDLLAPKPEIDSQFISHNGKRLYIIKVSKSYVPITVEGKTYIRVGDRSLIKNPTVKEFKKESLEGIKELSKEWSQFRNSCTGSLAKFIEHYQSVLNIISDLDSILYPTSSVTPTAIPEGKILARILFSSCADNFETYLSDLLFEIYLANPSTLKSSQQVTVKEVLDCADIQEFITFWAKKKLSKLTRGSVKGFIADNNQISELNAISTSQQEEIEKILQIRHLYAHNNGIVDEKFLLYFPGQFKLNDNHEMSIDQVLKLLQYLAETVSRIDKAAIKKYRLAITV